MLGRDRFWFGPGHVLCADSPALLQKDGPAAGHLCSAPGGKTLSREMELVDSLLMTFSLLHVWGRDLQNKSVQETDYGS